MNTPTSPRRVGRFRLDALIGRGGGGEVWKAWDEDLDRAVAVKLLQGAGETDRVRFEREARIAARLDHPGAVHVYEVGPGYIAMELVAGGSLDGRRFAPRDAARMLRDAALAVHAAHEVGLVHRDLKPHNLLLDADGSRVRVADFGLARFVDHGSTLTASGMMVGTPAYMSPEQARGELDHIDARSDVYGLGATLCELLTGRPPFEGADLLSLVVKVVDEPPPRLSVLDPSIPRDLDLIVRTCLEKAPADRYPSAAALAADLDRFLKGEQLETRQGSTFGRLMRRAYRRRSPLSLAVASLAVIVLVALVLAARLKEGQSAAVSAEEELLRELRKTARTCLDAALELRRAANLQGMDRVRADLEAVCAKVESRLPGLAEPHALKGQLYRARMEDARALAAQERALQLESGHPRARYERLVLTSELLRLEVMTAQREAWRQVGARVVQGATGRLTAAADSARLLPLKQRMTGDLQALEQNHGSLDEEELACARALCLLLEHDGFAKARPLLEAAGRRRAPLAEVIQALADVELASGDDGVARAIAVLDGAIARDAGYLPFLLRCASLRLDLAGPAASRGDDVTPMLAKAREDIDRALELQAASADAWQLLGRCHGTEALTPQGAARGEALYLAGIEALDRSIALDGGRHESWCLRTALKVDLAIDYAARGRDPSATLDEAAADASASLGVDPECAESYARRSAARINLAGWRLAHGGEADRLHEQATSDIEEALRRRPADPRLWFQSGELRLHIGLHRSQTRGDAAAMFLGAVADYDRSVGLRPSGGAFTSRANVRLLWANVSAPADASTLRRRAIQDASEAIRLIPAEWEPWWIRANAASHFVEGAEAQAVYDAVIADYGKAIERAPRRTEPLLDRAKFHATRAEVVRAAQGDPTAETQAAIEDAGRVLALNPRAAGAQALRGAVRGNYALWEAAQGRDPGTTYQAAIADYADALKLNPNDVECHLYEGNAWNNWGRWKRRRGESGREEDVKALAAYERAVRIQPGRQSQLGTAIEAIRKRLAR